METITSAQPHMFALEGGRESEGFAQPKMHSLERKTVDYFPNISLSCIGIKPMFGFVKSANVTRDFRRSLWLP